LVSGDDDGTIKVWDLATGKERVTLKGHSNRVTTVRFSPNDSPDNKMAPSVSKDGAIRLWEVATPK
jgi:WD40 repeat protein